MFRIIELVCKLLLLLLSPLLINAPSKFHWRFMSEFLCNLELLYAVSNCVVVLLVLAITFVWKCQFVKMWIHNIFVCGARFAILLSIWYSIHCSSLSFIRFHRNTYNFIWNLGVLNRVCVWIDVCGVQFVGCIANIYTFFGQSAVTTKVNCKSIVISNSFFWNRFRIENTKFHTV